ncbi:MAG: hypothetical protein K0U47_06300 [Epsilonproteobacteria bacterium]|nr:hypothetical protein [Campylobacterota bacterium]
MPHKLQEYLEKIQEALHQAPTISQEEKSLMLERLEEWRHEDEAMRIIPEKLAEISMEIRPILKEIGLL